MSHDVTLEEIKISTNFPPNMEDMRVAFPACEKEKAVFMFDNVIYNPFNGRLTPDVIEHERVHAIQQKREGGSFVWYVKYIKDEAFRLAQEVEAYRVQYQYIKKRVKDRELVNWFLGKLAEALSSEVYGSICTRAEAYAMISKG